MRISIAMATYNGTAYLQAQLNSYLSQERLPDEIIVCDDASTDDTVAILEEFKNRAPFQVQIVKNKNNLGYTNNFEKSLSLCVGDIVLFSDQDDIWLPNKISTLEKIFHKNPAISLVIHDGELVTEKLNTTGLTKLGQILSGGYTKDSFVTGTLSAMRRDLIDIALPFPNDIAGGHDGWVHTMAKLTDKRMIVRDILQQLRRHSTNTSEWVASSIKKINKIDVFKSQFTTMAAESYEDRLFLNKSLQERFSAIKLGHIKCSFSIDFEKIEKILDDEYNALDKRQKLLTYGFFGRKSEALSMLIKQKYKHFNGFKSFIRDFFR